jgi:hypothetical protein
MAQKFWSISRKNKFLADQSLYSIFLTIQRVLFSPMLLDTQMNITLLQSSRLSQLVLLIRAVSK